MSNTEETEQRMALADHQASCATCARGESCEEAAELAMDALESEGMYLEPMATFFDDVEPSDDPELGVGGE